MTDRRELVLERLLVVRCQAGDEAAFEDLVVRHGPRLRWFLGKLLGVSGDPDDLAQEVWIEVFRKIGRLRSPAAFRTWLYRIARDRAFAEIRRSGRARIAGGEAPGDLAAAEPEPDFTAEDVERVRAGLDGLRPEHREVLLLRFVEGMSYEEIAEATGVAVGTVRSRIHYAKDELKREMERMDRR